MAVSVLRIFLMLPLAGLYSEIVEYTGYDYLLFFLSKLIKPYALSSKSNT